MAESTIKKLEIGIPGVDNLVKGGVPQGSVVLLAGGPGTGKTTFGLQWLLHGIEAGEPGVYVSLEQEPEKIMEDMRRFDLHIKKAIDNKGLKIIKSELYKFEALKNAIEDAVDEIGAKRVVIDPITVLSMYWEKPIQARKGVIEIIELVRQVGCTGLLVSEVSEMSKEVSTFPVEEFICDGVFFLGFERKGGVYERSLVVKKLRGSEHSTRICPLKITDKGIVVYSQEEVF